MAANIQETNMFQIQIAEGNKVFTILATSELIEMMNSPDPKRKEMAFKTISDQLKTCQSSEAERASYIKQLPQLNEISASTTAASAHIAVPTPSISMDKQHESASTTAASAHIAVPTPSISMQKQYEREERKMPLEEQTLNVEMSYGKEDVKVKSPYAKLWSREEEKILIHVRTSTEFEFNTSKCHETLWSRLTCDLNRNGLNVTKSQIMNKWKSMKKKYKDTGDANNKTGNAKVSFLSLRNV